MIKQSCKDFARWRKRQTFASPEISSRAMMVERDLELLSSLPNPLPATIATVHKDTLAFEAMLATQQSSDASDVSGDAFLAIGSAVGSIAFEA